MRAYKATFTEEPRSPQDNARIQVIKYFKHTQDAIDTLRLTYSNKYPKMKMQFGLAHYQYSLLTEDKKPIASLLIEEIEILDESTSL